MKQNLKQNVKQNVVQATSPMQRSRMMSGSINNSTCGRPWKNPLTKIQGRIRNVEYRIQPFTGRRGLHLDIETGWQTDTVIHVYPERLTAKCPSVFYFRVGDPVTITGSEFFTGKGAVNKISVQQQLRKGRRCWVFGIHGPEPLNVNYVAGKYAKKIVQDSPRCAIGCVWATAKTDS